MTPRPLTLLWAILGMLLVLSALFAPWIAPSDPSTDLPDRQFAPPGAEFLLGADQFGRDVLSRTLWGGRYSLTAAALATLLALTIGCGVGGVAGAFGGLIDAALMRLIDVLLAIPGLLLAMALIALIGPGQQQAALAVGLSLAPGLSRLVRAAILTVRSAEYVTAARALGAGRLYILTRHLLPGIAGQVLAFSTLMFAWALLNLAALDFLGLTGGPWPVTWGRMLNEGRAYLRDAPWIAFSPGLMLMLCVLTVSALGSRWRHDPAGGVTRYR
ncbi:MAG: ABC transporter permease subunit [Anaerolineae bacterium]